MASKFAQAWGRAQSGVRRKDRRFECSGIEKIGEIDFPFVVADPVGGALGANGDAQIRQMAAHMGLLETAAKAVYQFRNRPQILTSPWNGSGGEFA